MLTVYFGFALMLFAAVYWSAPQGARSFLILAANLSFFWFLGPLPFALFAGIFAVVLFAARRARVRTVLIPTVLIALAPLLFFKIGRSFLGLQEELPVGLSYMTLMLLGFYFDLYRGTLKEIPSVSAIGTFSSFFPIISMGPIERFKRLAPQLARPRDWNHTRASEAIFLICLGLFKKVVIADRLANFVFDSPRNALQFDGVELVVFMFVSFVQIYCDFSGFVDIARGYSKFLGIEVIDNFDQPYLSRNVPDIWRRWHISLVDWLRDFVYNPIALRTQNLYVATAAVMFAVAMWHNISWRSVGWATYWSTLYGASIMFRKRGVVFKIPNLLKIALTVGVISFSTFFFLPRTISELSQLSWNLLSATHFSEGRMFDHVGLTSSDAAIAAIACSFVVIFETWHRKMLKSGRSESSKLLLFLFVAVFLFMATVAVGVGDSRAFLYLRF